MCVATGLPSATRPSRLTRAISPPHRLQSERATGTRDRRQGHPVVGRAAVVAVTSGDGSPRRIIGSEWWDKRVEDPRLCEGRYGLFLAPVSH